MTKFGLWKVVDDFEDARSGIWQEQDGIHLLGRVHNVLDYGDGKTIIDVYMQNGSELFTVDSETVDDVPEANDGLEITVGNLYFTPLIADARKAFQKCLNTRLAILRAPG